ncbi:MAG: hypothetical protein GX804_09005 [Lentisphaerae bacterium]|nr:hypothetical protein [Lentisphaerota bacterium]
MSLKPIAVIEIGTTQTVAMLGSCSSKGDGTINIEAFCTEKTSGIRKSEVQSAQSVTTTARGLLTPLSKKGRADINKVNIVYSGGNLQYSHIFGKTEIDNIDEIVEPEDKETAFENLRASPLQSGRTTLEEIPGDFILDNSRKVEDPEGLRASELSVTGIRTHVDSNSYYALIDAIDDSLCDVERVYSEAASSPLGCTTKEQREAGVLVINLGGGSSSWSITKDDRVVAVGHLAVGGDHVTNDILSAFHTGTDESANALKHSYAQATLDGIDPAARVEIPKNLGITKYVNLRALTTVINARLDETLRILKNQITDSDAMDGLGSGIVLCGGGAFIKGLSKLTSQIFGGIPCTMGSMPVTGFSEIDDDPENLRYAAVYGALTRAIKVAFEEEDFHRGGFPSLFGIFGRRGGSR